MRVLITGGSGFIGKNLSEQLEGNELLLPSHKQLDLTNSTQVKLYMKNNQPDIIIHCADIGAVEWETSDCYTKNMRMFKNLMRNLKPNQIMY